MSVPRSMRRLGMLTAPPQPLYPSCSPPAKCPHRRRWQTRAVNHPHATAVARPSVKLTGPPDLRSAGEGTPAGPAATPKGCLGRLVVGVTRAIGYRSGRPGCTCTDLFFGGWLRRHGLSVLDLLGLVEFKIGHPAQRQVPLFTLCTPTSIIPAEGNGGSGRRNWYGCGL